MYRYSADNAVTYTPDDLALYRESAFALWMERLTLENPDHGIPPDVHSAEPVQSIERQDDIVDTLRAEGRNVALIDWDQDEPARRAATLAAMEDGADFIVNGALSTGNLAGTANLMMRTSGYSQLGDFLYVPCDTQGQGTFVSAFRLCFLCDALQEMQGQLPPQMLLIRGDADVQPLQTEDHIYYYRAVKKRFLAEMASFRKHRMPDPAESSHFGRWSECASEVLKQRALSEEAAEQALKQEQSEREQEGVTPLDTAPAGEQEASSVEESEGLAENELAEAEAQDKSLREAEAMAAVAEAVAEPAVAEQQFLESVDQGAEQEAGHGVEQLHEVAAQGRQVASAAGGAQRRFDREDKVSEVAVTRTATKTLAEQASSLQPDTFKVVRAPGHTPNLARFPRAVPSSKEGNRRREGRSMMEGTPRRRASDIALQNLEFIGSGPDMPFEEIEPPAEPCEGLQIAGAPPPNLRHLAPEEAPVSSPHHPERRVARLPDLEPPAPALLPPEQPAARKPHPLDSVDLQADESSLVDLDGVPSPALTPVIGTLADAALSASMRSSRLNPAADSDDEAATPSAPDAQLGNTLSEEPPWAPSRTFSDSLITSERIDDF